MVLLGLVLVLLLLGVGSPAHAVGLPAPAADARAGYSQPDEDGPCFSVLPARPQSLPAREAALTPTEDSAAPLSQAPGPWAADLPPLEDAQLSDPGSLGERGDGASLATGNPGRRDARRPGRLGRCDLHWPDRVQAHQPQRPIDPAALVNAAVLREAPSEGAPASQHLVPPPGEDRLLGATRLCLSPPGQSARLLLPPPLQRGPQTTTQPQEPPPR